MFSRLKNVIVVWLLLVSVCSANVDQLDSNLQMANSTCSLSFTSRCQDFQNCNVSPIGYFNYLKWYYCTFSYLGTFGALIPICSFLLLLFYAMGVTASLYLCPNLHTISRGLNMSHNLAGLTLLAFGNGAPDIFGTYKALDLNSGDLALSELIGAAFFILTVVIGTMAITHPFQVRPISFWIDCFSYLIILIFGFIIVLTTKLTQYLAIILFSVYILYSIVVLGFNSYITSRNETVLSILKAVKGIQSSDDIDELLQNDLDDLPTIDEVITTPENDFYSLPSGHYGVSVILAKLRSQSRAFNSIPLDDIEDDLLSISEPNTTSNTSVLDQFNCQSRVDDANFEEELNLESNQSLSITKLLFPSFLHFNNNTPLVKFQKILTSPIDFLLRISIPVRDNASIEVLEAYQRNEFISQFTNEVWDPEPIVDFVHDKCLLQIQSFFGLIFCSTWFLGMIKFWTVFVPVTITIVTIAELFIIHLYQPHNTQNIKIIYYSVSFLGFLTSISWTSVFATEVISILKSVCLIFNISDEILGLTIFALGNSIGDLITNYTISKMGMPLMAFSACFGGIILAFSSLGLSALLISEKRGLSYIQFDESKPVLWTLCFLLIVILALFILVSLNNFWIDRKIGLGLILIWVFAFSSSLTMGIYTQ